MWSGCVAGLVEEPKGLRKLYSRYELLKCWYPKAISWKLMQEQAESSSVVVVVDDVRAKISGAATREDPQCFGIAPSLRLQF